MTKQYVKLTTGEGVEVEVCVDDANGPCDDWDMLNINVEVIVPTGYTVVDVAPNADQVIRGSGILYGMRQGFAIEAHSDRRATPTEKLVVVDVGDGVKVQREGRVMALKLYIWDDVL